MELEKPSKWNRLSTKVHALLHDKKGVRYFIAALLLIIATGGITFALIRPTPAHNSNLTVTPKPPEPQKYYSPLTGLEVKDKAATKKQITAIMIENSPDARPQSGLKEAGVVFEAIAEGGITRFAALYQQTKPALIGPVRSVRPYYLTWIKPFDPAVAHIGGSANALREVRSGQYKDIDQFFNAQAYWRATDRYAPHNVYTSFQKLDALNAAKHYTSSKATGFIRQPIPKKHATPPKPKKLEKASSIAITISSPWYNPSYTYNTKTKLYARSLNGTIHNDREKGQLAPRVVIVMKVPTKIGLEDGYREQMTTSGSGDVYVFQDGTVVKGSWHKKNKNTQLTFTDKNNQPIPLGRGQTWITVTAPEKAVSWR